MKIALVHELLTMRGGAERVLRILADMYPEAPIYTLLYDEKKLGEWFPHERVCTSSLQKWANVSTNHHWYLSKFPSAVEAWDFSAFDVVLSTSSAFVHGIITNGTPKHICYVHSPARYLWDRTQDVLERANPLARMYLRHLFHKLRIWDAEVAARPDVLLAASKEVQRRIELYWRRESDVVYPPIDDFWLEGLSQSPTRDYFFIASTLVHYKQIDIAIEACNKLNLPLKIAGEGPAKSRLQSLAGSTIEFVGYVDQEELRNLYANAIATIFPGKEDFGLVPLESMACGTPVIAQATGGALETVTSETGAFFSEPTASSLQETLQNFDQNSYSSDACRAHAAQFSSSEFCSKIAKYIEVASN